MNKEFIIRLQNELTNIEADHALSAPELTFAAWTGEIFFNLYPQKVVDDFLLYSNESSIAVFGFADEGASRATIVTCSYIESNDVVEADDNEINSLINIWRDLRNKTLQGTSICTDLIQTLEENRITDIINYIVLNKSVPKAVLSGVNKGIRVFDLKDISTIYLRLKQPLKVEEPISLKLKISKENSFKGNFGLTDAKNENILAISSAIPLGIIYEWVSQYKNGLFAENLRYRLRQYNKDALEIDRKIQETLANHPERMFIQNNGITLICESIESDDENVQSEEITEISLQKPQIVNGCQTSWAIYDFIEQNGHQGVQNGFLLAKIIQTTDPNLAQIITSSSNRQNAILSRDQKVKDERQIQISKNLSERMSDLRIFWDYVRGGWENIKYRNEEVGYQVKSSKRLFRKIDNQLAGQIMLAMAGAIHEAKNRGGQIFDNDTLYQIAFGYDLSPEQRFKDLQLPYLRSGDDSMLSDYTEDLLFGFAIYQYAEAVFKYLYSQRSQKLTNALETATSVHEKAKIEMALNKIAQEDFVKYWLFDVVRLIHIIVEKWVELGEIRENIRKKLIGDIDITMNLDPLFKPKSARASLFFMEHDLNVPTILNHKEQSEQLPVLGRWFLSLETICSKIISNLKHRDPTALSRNLILNRSNTHNEFVKGLHDVIASKRIKEHFPMPL
jgi:hypothetical protein